MILSSISDLTRLQIKLISYFVPCPIFLSFKKKPIQYKIRYKALSNPIPIIAFALFAIFLVSSAIYHLTRPNLEITTKASVTFFWSILPIAIIMAVSSLYTNAEKIVTLLNLILLFEQTLCWTLEIRIYQKIVKVIVGLLGLAASLIAPIFLILINIIEPERAPFIGSVINAGTRIEYYFGHSAAIIGQAWIYFWLAPGLCMTIFNIFIVSIFSMLVSLVEIKR